MATTVCSRTKARSNPTAMAAIWMRKLPTVWIGSLAACGSSIGAETSGVEDDSATGGTAAFELSTGP